MADEDVSYCRQRADIELERAQQAKGPKVVAEHYKLAEAYLERTTAGAPTKQNANA